MATAVLTFSIPAETEAEVIAQALRRRDPEFLARLVSQYHYRLLRYMVYLTARREQAEDLVQETWMRVLRHSAQFDGRSRFEPWLFSIARHLAIDHLRQRTARDSRAEGDADAVLDTPAPDGESPFAAAARSEDAAHIAVAMTCLAPIYREALLLRFQEEMPLEEIAVVVGAPVATVASRIRRGLAILRVHLEGAGHAA